MNEVDMTSGEDLTQARIDTAVSIVRHSQRPVQRVEWIPPESTDDPIGTFHVTYEDGSGGFWEVS